MTVTTRKRIKCYNDTEIDIYTTNLFIPMTEMCLIIQYLLHISSSRGKAAISAQALHLCQLSSKSMFLYFPADTFYTLYFYQIESTLSL